MEWVMAHPWMTFFLVGFLLLVIDNCIGNFFRYLITIREKK